jgi:hypothetical protein
VGLEDLAVMACVDPDVLAELAQLEMLPIEVAPPASG